MSGSNELTQEEAYAIFQASATLSGIQLLVQKGIISQEEYNEHMQKSEDILLKRFKDIEARGFVINDVIEFIYRQHKFNLKISNP